MQNIYFQSTVKRLCSNIEKTEESKNRREPFWRGTRQRQSTINTLPNHYTGPKLRYFHILSGLDFRKQSRTLGGTTEIKAE